MTRPNLLSISELVELASLDAFGLLDGEDSLAFEESFLAAPESVQSSVRQLQAELVSDENLLGSEVPDDELRAKVLDRVAVAMREQDALRQPLATIGPAGSGHREDLQVSVGFIRSIWTWRAVALVLVGVSVTLVIFGMVRNREYNELIQAINSRQAQFVLNQPPGSKDQISWPTDDGSFVFAALVDPTGSSGRVRVLMNPDGSNPRVAYDLDRRLTPLTIYAVDDQGEFGPSGAEYVVAVLDPRQTSAEVSDGFNPAWLGKTRLVARDSTGRDVLIQV